jgi:hypothetical protein
MRQPPAYNLRRPPPRSHQDFRGAVWDGGAWHPATLRVTAHGLEELGDASGTATWRCDHQHLGSPGVMTLAGGPGDAKDAPPFQDGAFAVFSRLARRPRVFAVAQRKQLLTVLQSAAHGKLGLRVAGEPPCDLSCCCTLVHMPLQDALPADTLALPCLLFVRSRLDGPPPSRLRPLRPAVDAASRTGARELLEAIISAERSNSARAEEAPLGQWEVEALAPRADVLPPQLAAAAPGVSARRMSVEAMAAMGQALAAGGESRGVGRAIAVGTCSSLLRPLVGLLEVP